MTWGIFKTDSISDTVKKLQEKKQLDEGDSNKRLISKHGSGVYTAKVYHNKEYNEYSAHMFKHGKHMGEGPVSYHDDKQDAQDTAESSIAHRNKHHARDDYDHFYGKDKHLGEESTEFSLFSENELDMLISEASNDNMTAGAWINDFLHAQQRLMATKGMGKDTSEKRKDAKALALAAYYNHQARGKKAEFTEGRLNLDAKEIKHINLKDKRNDAEIMEPRAEGEKAFVDTHTLIVTNDPTQTKYDAGTGKVGKAVEPKAQGAGKYDAKEKLGNQGITSKKGEFSEAIVNTGPTATGCQVGEVIDTEPKEKKAKKTYGKFKQEIGHEIK